MILMQQPTHILILLQLDSVYLLSDSLETNYIKYRREHHIGSGRFPQTFMSLNNVLFEAVVGTRCSLRNLGKLSSKKI